MITICTANAHMSRRAPYNSGFVRKTRAKLFVFQVELYFNKPSFWNNICREVPHMDVPA
jgi:hypothetical protein